MLCHNHKGEYSVVFEALEAAIQKGKETKQRADQSSPPTAVPAGRSSMCPQPSTTSHAKQKPDFIPYHARPLSEAAARIRVENIMARRFTRSEDEPGYIYIWSNPSFPNILKIGKAKDVGKRLKRKGYTCKKVLTQEIDPYQRRIRHVKRAEDIIHATLGLYHLEEQTCACRSLHHEYFYISREVALETIEEVRQYMEATYGVEGQDPEDAIWSPSPLKQSLRGGGTVHSF
jgi:hypothetical protein